LDDKIAGYEDEIAKNKEAMKAVGKNMEDVSELLGALDEINDQRGDNDFKGFGTNFKKILLDMFENGFKTQTVETEERSSSEEEVETTEIKEYEEDKWVGNKFI